MGYISMFSYVSGGCRDIKTSQEFFWCQKSPAEVVWRFGALQKSDLTPFHAKSKNKIML